MPRTKQIHKEPSEMTPTERELARIKAEYESKRAQAKSKGFQNDLVNYVKNERNPTAEGLYKVAKPFCNNTEAIKRAEKQATPETKK